MRIAVTLEIGQEVIERIGGTVMTSPFSGVEDNRAMRAFNRIAPTIEQRYRMDNDFWRCLAYAVHANEYEGLEMLADAIERYAPYLEKVYMEQDKDVRTRMHIVYIGVQINSAQRSIDDHVAASNDAAVRRHVAAQRAVSEPAKPPRRLRLRGMNR